MSKTSQAGSELRIGRQCKWRCASKRRLHGWRSPRGQRQGPSWLCSDPDRNLDETASGCRCYSCCSGLRSTSRLSQGLESLLASRGPWFHWCRPGEMPCRHWRRRFCRLHWGRIWMCLGSRPTHSPTTTPETEASNTMKGPMPHYSQ